MASSSRLSVRQERKRLVGVVALGGRFDTRLQRGFDQFGLKNGVSHVLWGVREGLAGLTSKLGARPVRSDGGDGGHVASS